MKPESIALHHGYESESTTKAAAVPIIKQHRTPLTIPSMGRIYLILKCLVISTPA